MSTSRDNMILLPSYNKEKTFLRFNAHGNIKQFV